VLQKHEEFAPDIAPAVIVGSGPAGVRAAKELRRHAPKLPIVLYGQEPWRPYNRVRLSAFLAGELSWEALSLDSKLPEDVEARFHCAVVAINPKFHFVWDSTGRRQVYSKLVLATGSHPHVPDISGIDQLGVYTFRDMTDAQLLLARRVRSRRTVVLGGGLLGLEAARAMQRFNTDVWIVEHSPILMSSQLDERASWHLQGRLQAMGINVVLGDSVKQVLSRGRLSGVRLRSGREIACDTLIVATGIRPNIELARKAGLKVGRGIRVNDGMRTSDPDIYAVGECAEHRERVYGIVAPALEQAAVAAHDIAGGAAGYRGSVFATRLKVLDVLVFGIGHVTQETVRDRARQCVFESTDIYRKVIVQRGRLIGAIAVGDWPDLNRVQEAVSKNRFAWPWQLWRFRVRGSLWPEAEETCVTRWSTTAVVCNCTGVTRGQLSNALAAGCKSVEALAANTGASTVCGSCRPLLAKLAGGSAPLAPIRAYRTLFGAAAMALVAALAFFLSPAVPYADSVEYPWQWDQLWRDNFLKQVSGYSLLALSVIALVVSLRKRVRAVRLGDFALWRVFHALVGIGILAALLIHTGGRLGSELNQLLLLCFMGLLVSGGIAGSLVAMEHRMGSTQRLRKSLLWAHLYLFWPVPVLLSFHVLKGYYF
ncbi:MAG: FAD-dependent oxidoreductase, partial [Burkholderiales bacterium]